MGVEELAGDFGHAGEGVDPAVNGIARDGAAGGGGVDTNLMSATGVQAEFEESGTRPRADDFPIGFGGAAAAADGHALAGNGVATDGAFPRACVSAGPTENVGEIGFCRFPISELSAELAMGGIIFRSDEKAGGLPI